MNTKQTTKASIYTRLAEMLAMGAINIRDAVAAQTAVNTNTNTNTHDTKEPTTNEPTETL